MQILHNTKRKRKQVDQQRFRSLIRLKSTMVYRSLYGLLVALRSVKHNELNWVIVACIQYLARNPTVVSDRAVRR